MPKPIAPRFHLDEEAATTWLTKIVASNEAGEYIDDELSDLDEDWCPRDDEGGSRVDRLIQQAQREGVLSCPGGEVLFLYEASYDYGDDYFQHVIDLTIARPEAADCGSGRLRVATGSEEFRRIGDPDKRGVQAAVYLLQETANYANSALRDLDLWIASRKDPAA